jgi:hypothetical protein
MFGLFLNLSNIWAHIGQSPEQFNYIFYIKKKMNPFQSAVNDLVSSQMKILVSPCDFDFSNYQLQIAFLLSGAKLYKTNK